MLRKDFDWHKVTCSECGYTDDVHIHESFTKDTTGFTVGVLHVSRGVHRITIEFERVGF